MNQYDENFCKWPTNISFKLFDEKAEVNSFPEAPAKKHDVLMNDF